MQTHNIGSLEVSAVGLGCINPTPKFRLQTRLARSMNWSAAEKCARSGAQTLASNKFVKQRKRQRALDLSAYRMNSAYFTANRGKACCKNVKNRAWPFFLI